GLVLALALSGVIAGAAQLVAAGAGLGLALLDLAAGTAAVVPGGHVVMVAGWEAAAVWAGVALVAWWLWHSPRRPWLIAARVAFATTVFVATTLRDVFPLDACRCLTVFFLDVGQGDAALLRTLHGRWVMIDAGHRIELDGVALEVLSPDSLWMTLPLDVNEHGVVLTVTYGAVHLLFQADAGLPVEGRLAGTVGPVELLKVGHHGSRSATSDAWLDELAPPEATGELSNLL